MHEPGGQDFIAGSREARGAEQGAADKLADDITRRLLTRAQPHLPFPLDFLTRVSCPLSPPYPRILPGLLRTSQCTE